MLPEKRVAGGVGQHRRTEHQTSRTEKAGAAKAVAEQQNTSRER
jgi:hypothetical protein